jgi:hypothetical protein
VVAHVGVRFDCDDGVAVCEEDLGEHAGACADVGDAPRGRESAPGSQAVKYCIGGIALAVAVVIFGAAGESLSVVGHSDLSVAGY